jgi:hypothetical protein
MQLTDNDNHKNKKPSPKLIEPTIIATPATIARRHCHRPPHTIISETKRKGIYTWSSEDEVLIMQRIGLVMGVSTPSISATKAYEALYEAGPNAPNVEALEALFQSGEELRRQQRKRKPPS